MAEPSEPRSVSLPVVQTKPGKAPRMGSTRRGRWRTWVLVAVHVLIVAHIIQWLIMGTTLSPMEPSESMKTLELGLVNAGAILFGLAILSTLIFGRFFCGWLCHVVALQDACAWMMNRVGIRPKPFRSRLLVFVPLAMGFYMFIWPNFKRFAVAPALGAMDIAWPAWLRPVAPINVWQSEMIVEDFWATFPDWYIAVPFLLICGFVTVYFLGAKGFCTYACPYGGIFAPVDKVAPVRIRVTDACTQCGHCTSVCTSNVRVSEEVRDFGMVIDPGCMKCMDCVEVCPNDALYLGVGRPALGARPRNKETAKAAKAKRERRYDLSRWEEVGAAVLFVAVFLGTRGMLDQVPMLLAGGLAAIVTFLIIMSWWILVRPNTRLYGLVLKQKGQVRPAAFGFLALTLALAGVVAWGGQARYPRWRADIAYNQAVIPAGFVVRPEFAAGPDSRARAERGAAWLARADGFANGGTGWRLNAQHRTHQAYFLAVSGRLDEAAEALEEVIEHGNPGDGLVAQLIRLRQAGGATEAEINDLRRRVLERHPRLHRVRFELAMSVAEETDAETGGAYFRTDDADLLDDPGFLFNRVSYWRHSGRVDLALEGLREAIPVFESQRRSPSGWLADASGAAMRLGEAGLSLDLIDRAVEARGVHPGVLFAQAEVRATFGNPEGALESIDRGLAMRGGDSVASLTRAADLLMRLEESDRGAALYRRAAERSVQPFERAQIGQAMVRAGLGLRRPGLVEAGVEVMRGAAESSREPMIWHDMAPVLYQANRWGEAADAIVRAAELAPESVVLAERASELCMMVGDSARAERWREEARRRATP
ncbi:MAG: 4Fe-4S binding protein [Phycisphaerales bacterium]|nr:4Fe-4S binding protein [Planctomycetota bacterium]MCH8507976.1 4Fe-4S binding protein [Phycisphaerales bacterium]